MAGIISSPAPLLALMLTLSGTPVLRAAPVVVAADFAVSADYPLSKEKFAVFNSGLVPLERYERDIHLYDEVRPESLRIDLWWGGGGWLRQPVSGSPNAVHYDFAEMDRLALLLNTHNVLPYWAYCYVPEPLQNPHGDAKTNFENHALWGEILANFARHARTGDPQIHVGYHEIYNEPDNHPEFYKGRLADYLKMYRAGATAIRRTDPDAVIGGPSLAFNDTWVPPFLDFVKKQGLPLDFFSFHYYPSSWEGLYPRVPAPAEGPKSIEAVLDGLRQDLARHPEFATTESHLNEFNSYRIDYPKGGRQDHYPLASAMLHDYHFFLSRPDLTRVHWAQFMDSGYGNYSGMISIDGHRKALFNAYALYARMPVDRRQLTLHGPRGVEGLASSDPHQAAVLLWNRQPDEQTIQATLAHVPFPQGTLRVYRIDANHASWGDNPANEMLVPVETHDDIPTANFAWSGPIPPDGILCLELSDTPDRPHFQASPLARVLRVLHYYPDRSSSAYADFDRTTWIARLGMAHEKCAEARIGALVQHLPPSLTVSIQTEGHLQRVDADSLLGVRLDYASPGGIYSRSVLYHGPCGPHPDLYSADRDTQVPWGTRRQADQEILVPDLARFNLRPADHAPADWTGRAQLSFILQNSGPGTRARISLSSP